MNINHNNMKNKGLFVGVMLIIGIFLMAPVSAVSIIEQGTKNIKHTYSSDYFTVSQIKWTGYKYSDNYVKLGVTHTEYTYEYSYWEYYPPNGTLFTDGRVISGYRWEKTKGDTQTIVTTIRKTNSKYAKINEVHYLNGVIKYAYNDNWYTKYDALVIYRNSDFRNTYLRSFFY